MKAISKNKPGKPGRPTIFNETILAILTSAMQKGCSVQQACSYAKISIDSYYYWMETRPDFARQMEYAKNYLNYKAKALIEQDIVEKKDINTAKWYLEKTEYKQITQNNTQINVAPSQLLVEFLESKPNEQQNTDNADTN